MWQCIYFIGRPAAFIRSDVLQRGNVAMHLFHWSPCRGNAASSLVALPRPSPRMSYGALPRQCRYFIGRPAAFIRQS
jgi:hypothetical protein